MRKHMHAHEMQQLQRTLHLFMSCSWTWCRCVCVCVCPRFSSLIQEWRAKLIDAGFQELVFEDILPLLLQHIDGISQGLLGQEALEGAYR